MPIFDPLRYLRYNLRCNVVLTATGDVRIVFESSQEPHIRKKALTILEVYKDLLKLQLQSGDASVRKLLAQGKIRIKNGRFVYNDPQSIR